MKSIKKVYKALVPLVVLLVVLVGEVLGFDTGLGVPEAITLVLVSAGVWAVPNKDNST